MSIFGNIMGKIFHRGQHADQPAGQAPKPAAPAAAPTPPPAAPAAAPSATPVPPPAAPAAGVDVGAVLAEMASMKGDGGGNYRSSIVDLLKLLDLDSGLGARKELAGELGVHAGEHGSAEQNIALHKAVMARLAANGGIVPDDLRD